MFICYLQQKKLHVCDLHRVQPRAYGTGFCCFSVAIKPPIQDNAKNQSIFPLLYSRNDMRVEFPGVLWVS